LKQKINTSNEVKKRDKHVFQTVLIMNIILMNFSVGVNKNKVVVWVLKSLKLVYLMIFPSNEQNKTLDFLLLFCKIFSTKTRLEYKMGLNK